ncbi:hypothetical protein HMSSN036_34710 [Paenibacillus macerans]|nr:hypothetical protein HMSSN036_34710 [Paenibacillus macerans]
MVERWFKIFQIAATYIGTVVGAGFASGQSIMQFLPFTVPWGGGDSHCYISVYVARNENDGGGSPD